MNRPLVDVPVPTVPRFYFPLVLEYLDGRTWRITAPFSYASVILARVLQIPAGFLTDFASIPRVLWALLPPTGAYGKPAVVHDFLYRTTGIVTRAQADAVFLEALEELKVNWFTRHMLYRGVRLGGGRSYQGGL